MSGRYSRNKGKRVEREARDLLVERGYQVESLGDGESNADYLATRAGKSFWVEVKGHVRPNFSEFRTQARGNTPKNKTWLLMWRVPDCPGVFHVEQGVGCKITVVTTWHSNEWKRRGDG